MALLGGLRPLPPARFLDVPARLRQRLARAQPSWWLYDAWMYYNHACDQCIIAIGQSAMTAQRCSHVLLMSDQGGGVHLPASDLFKGWKGHPEPSKRSEHREFVSRS